MQAQLFATTKELKESTIIISHQQNIVEDLKQHMVVATNARLHAEETLQRF
jgi:ABC-type sulfate/molybdate transport systems ATPase subunit